MKVEDPSSETAISQMAADAHLGDIAAEFMVRSCEHRYSYNFTWLGRPVIQYPQDLMALQEIIWSERPQLIVETGVAHGGATIFYASMLELLGGDGKVAAVDTDIRPHNRAAIEAHPLSRRITLISGSSIDADVAHRVRQAAAGCDRVLVVLDSDHARSHVARELELYSPLVKAGSHLVVLDTIIERLPSSALGDRPWGPGNSPMIAVKEFLHRTERFVIDDRFDKKLLISVAPSGYLRCIKD